MIEILFSELIEYYSQSIYLLLLVLLASLLKIMALWHAGKNKQKGWFIVLAIFNTLGILPLIYLVFFRRKSKNE